MARVSPLSVTYSSEVGGIRRLVKEHVTYQGACVQFWALAWGPRNQKRNDLLAFPCPVMLVILCHSGHEIGLLGLESQFLCRFSRPQRFHK